MTERVTLREHYATIDHAIAEQQRFESHSLTAAAQLGRFGLHFATSRSDVEGLLQFGAPIDGLRVIEYGDGQQHLETPLLTAFIDGRVEVADALIGHGAVVDAPNAIVARNGSGFGHTALHMLTSRQDVDGVRILLGEGAIVDLQTTLGWTPLHFAAHKDNAALVAMLTDAGADPNVEDFDGNTPIGLAGPRTVPLLQGVQSQGRIQRGSTATQVRTTADVDLEAHIYPDFPAGWASARDLMEGFLLAAALEFRARAVINPQAPLADSVHHRLSPRYHFDPFGSLLQFGPMSDAERLVASASVGHDVNPSDLAAFAYAGERIGRLPLLAMVWKLVDELVSANGHLRDRGDREEYEELRRKVGGAVLGKHGTALFVAALEREWFVGEQPRPLTRVELDFIEGHPIPGVGSGILHPNGAIYTHSIWLTAFRLIERRTPEHYIDLLGHRLAAVESILDRGAELGRSGARNVWPGWMC